MAKGLHDTWTGLRDALAGINGSTGGYWHDFAGAVYEKDLTPEEFPGLQNTYLCVPFDEIRERFDEQDAHGLTPVTEFVVLVYCRDSKEHPTETETNKLLSRIRDDIARLVLLDHTLDGTVANARLGPAVHLGAQEPGDHGFSEMIIEIKQIVDLNDIGSAA